jgi:hypothetical protein
MGHDHAKSTLSTRKQLNIVYFIDSAKTRSFSVSLKKVYIIAGFLAAMSLWSLGSIFIFVFLAQNAFETETELQSTRRLLFEYQVQHDRVFEKAYPLNENVALKFREKSPNDFLASSLSPNNQETSPILPKGLMAIVESDKSTITEEPPLEETNVPTAKKSPIDQKNSPNSMGRKKSTKEISSSLLDQIVLENQVLIKQGKIINLSVDMMNRDQNKKIEGYLWVIAEYTYINGEKIFVNSPESVEMAPNGKGPKNPQQSSSFAIKRFKRKSFHFKLPKDDPGELTKLTLGIVDKLGIDQREIPLTINMQIEPPEPLNL